MKTSLIVSLLLALFAVTNSVEARDVSKIPTDFHPEMSDVDRAFLFENQKVITSSSIKTNLPASVINHEYLPEVISQEQSPICAYMAMVYYYRTYQEAREQGIIHPNRTDNPETVMNAFTVAHLDNYTHFVRTFGAFSYNTGNWDFISDFPSPEGFADAAKHRPESISGVRLSEVGDGVDYLRTHLNTGDVIYAVVRAYSNFQEYNGDSGDGVDNGVYYAYRGSSNLEHAITIIGYDDNRAYTADGVDKTGAFLAVNSWSPGWGWTLPEVGTGGFIWIGYDFFTDEMAGSMVQMIDRKTEPCLDLALIDYRHEIAEELSMGIGCGDEDAGPDPGMDIDINDALGRMPVNGVVPVPIDRLTEVGARQFTLTALDLDLSLIYGPGVRLGLIRSFEIHLEGQEPLVSPDVPVTTTDCNILNPDTIPEHVVSLSLGIFTEERIDKRDIHPAVLGNGDIQLETADFDKDGDVDILECYPNSMGTYSFGVYQNNGSGEFRYYESNLPAGDYLLADVADFNNDGYLDVVLGMDAGFGIFYGGGALGNYTDSGLRFPVEDHYLMARAVDFNHDGFVDLAVSARIEYAYPLPEEYQWFFHWNNGDGTFSQSHWRLPFDYNQRPYMEFADMDRDGWEDLIVAGRDPSEGYAIHLFNYSGENLSKFAEITGFSYSGIDGIQVVDYNGDGWLDVVVKVFGQGCTVHLSNEGTSFTELETMLTGMEHFSFGDVDNDGIADIGAVGIVNEEPHNGLYRNMGDGRISYLTGPDNAPYVVNDIEDLVGAATALADFDQDGDLDFVVSGKFQKGGSEWYNDYLGLHYFENSMQHPNIPPDAPSLFIQDFNEGTGQLVVEWNPPADDVTPDDQLSYFLTAGTIPGWGDISPNTTTEEYSIQLRPDPAKNGGQCRATITIPTDRPTYVRIQAIDEALARSEWSHALEILPASSLNIFDVNRDQVVDACDSNELVKLLGNTDASSLEQGDLTGDGQVNSFDRVVLGNHLLALSAPSPDLIDVIDGTPEEGGEFVSDDLLIEFPPGVLAAPAHIEILPNFEQIPLENSVPGTMYHLTGLPDTRNGSFRIGVPADGLVYDETVLMYGRMSYPTSVWEETLTWATFSPVAVENGMMIFEVPAFTPVAAVDIRKGPYSIQYVESWFGVGGDVYKIESDHFLVQYPASVTSNEMLEVVDALEWGWETLTDDYGFSVKDIKGKVRVSVQDTGGLDGFYCPVMNYIAINLKNAGKTTDPYGYYYNTLTGVHEFFHRIIYQYRNLVNISGAAYGTLWPDEASAVWLETLYNGYTTANVYNENVMVPFQVGMSQQASKDFQSYGYGISGLIQYFTITRGKDGFPLQLWNNIRAGKTIRAAVSAAAAEHESFWWHDFMSQMIQMKVYDIEPSIIWNAVEGRTFNTTKQTEEDREFAGAGVYEDPHVDYLSSSMFRTIPDPAHQNTTMKVSHMFVPRNDIEAKFSVFAHQRKTPSTTYSMTHLKDGIISNGGYKCDIPIQAEWLTSSTWSVDGLASAITGPDGITNPFRYYVAITEDRVWNSPDGISVTNGGTDDIGNPGDGFAPTFDLTYSVDGPGIARMEYKDYGDIGHTMIAWVLGETPADYDFQMQATMTKSSLRVDDFDTYVIHTAGPMKTYRYTVSISTVGGVNHETTSDQASGKLTHTILQRDLIVGVWVTVVYDITETHYDTDGTVTNTIMNTNQVSGLSGVTLMVHPFIVQW
jgi:VCBS repeat protein/dockerin type I repeat protein/papain like protease